MKDHELKVKVVETGEELVVSKKYFHAHSGELEVLEGEPGEAPEATEKKTAWKPPGANKPKVIKREDGVDPVKEKEKNEKNAAKAIKAAPPKPAGTK